MKAMQAMKGNGYDYVILMIIFVFFILPSLIICYNLYYKEKENEEFNLSEKCIETVIPNEITLSWFFKPQGSLALVGFIFIIIVVLIKDLKSTSVKDRLKLYKKRL